MKKGLQIILHALMRLILWLFWGVRARSKIDKLPVIIIANHNSHLDIFVLFSLISLTKLDELHAVAAADYFGTGCVGKLTRFAFNAVLIDRQTRASPEEKMQPIFDCLEKGHSIVIFPEGSRGEPGVLQKFKSGIGELALQYPEIPIFPVVIAGAEKVLGKGNIFPVPFNIAVNIHSPVKGLFFLNNNQTRKDIALYLESIFRANLHEN